MVHVAAASPSPSIGLVLILGLVSYRLVAVHNASGFGRGALMRKPLALILLSSLMGVFVLAPSAFAQGSFCTTSATASGESVTKCVDAPSPTPSATASPDVTVISGGPLTPSPAATSVAQAAGGTLPPTGGELSLISAALLLGSGVLCYAILRRSN
jgi:hypothetical protein